MAYVMLHRWTGVWNSVDVSNSALKYADTLPPGYHDISVSTVKMFIEPSASTEIIKPNYSLYTAVILTTVDDTQITILLKLYKIQHILAVYIKCQDAWMAMESHSYC